MERIFGVLKRRFRILASEPEYPFNTQVNLVMALTTLHNFIRTVPGENDYLENIEDLYVDLREPESFIIEELESNSEAKRFRNNIASDMWNEYLFLRNTQR